jgi:hypothetical protein
MLTLRLWALKQDTLLKRYNKISDSVQQKQKQKLFVCTVLCIFLYWRDMEHGMVFRRIRYFEYGLGLPMLHSSFKIHFETFWYIHNLQDTFKYSLSFKYRYNSVENVMFVWL